MSHEKVVKVGSGWLWLVLNLGSYVASIALFVDGVRGGGGWPIAGALLLMLTAVVMSCGFFIVNPNESRVLQLFGTYKGTVKDTGFQWANPFYTKTLMSLRLYNFETGSQGNDSMSESARSRRPSKVNDKDGNPVEIAAVVSWRVVDTYDAVFSVDKYQDYIHVQSEASLRNLASHYFYDSVDDSV